MSCDDSPPIDLAAIDVDSLSEAELDALLAGELGSRTSEPEVES
jgi:hypothetical protein